MNKFPDSQALGLVRGSDGMNYTLHFYGENEGAAVITGPSAPTSLRLREVPEVHREPASDATDARTKLDAWRRTNGWPM